VPVFCTVTDCAALVEPTVVLPKVRLEGLVVSVAVAPFAPVPVRLTVLGLLVALLVIVSVPVLVPVAVGWNVTFTVQLAPAAMLDPQVFVCA